MSVFNTNRKYEDGVTPSYPLFLGPNLSLSDGVDVTYKEIEDAIFLQRANFWHENSVDMSNDRIQFPTLPKTMQDISILNLAWQSNADSIAGRAPIAALIPFVSNPELEELLTYWQLFEQIHSRTYQHIIKTVFPDPAAVRNRVANLEQAMVRLDIITREFDKLVELGAEYTLGHIDANNKSHRKIVLKQIIKTVGALYAMESVQFMTSFACTFALANQKVLTGTCDQVKKIAKDEKLHISFGRIILNILSNEPDSAEIYKECLPFLKNVMDETIKAEYVWADYLFSEGRQIIGLNAVLTKEYIDYLATTAYADIGLVYDKPTTEHPINWIEGYLNPEKLQVAPQERDNTNYTIGSVKNDFGDLDWDDGCMGFASADFI